MRCCAGDGGARPAGSVALRGRRAGGGRKPPRAAAVKSRRGERRGKRRAESASGVDHEGERKRTTDDVSKERGDIETGDALEPRDEPGGCLPIGQAGSRIEGARAGSGALCGTCETVAPRRRAASGAVWACGRSWKREPQAAETARARVAMRGTGAGRLVVAVMPGNAGGAKGAGRPGLFRGPPLLAGGGGGGGRSRSRLRSPSGPCGR